MSTESHTSIPGIVRNGVVVLQTKQELPEGTHVEILVKLESLPQQLREELAAWDEVSDEAWKMIDQWESEEQ